MGNKITNTLYGKMFYPAQDTIIGRSLELYGEWYQSEMDCMKPYIPKGGVCIDAGANIGCHTLFFARQTGPEGTVIAFEPQRILFQILCANITLNDLRQVFTFQAALGKERGLTFLPEVDYDQPGNFGMISTRQPDNQTTRQVGVPTDLVRLDDFSFSRIHLIKIDIEGMEPELLLGAKATIARHRPVLYIEYYPERHSTDLLEIIHSLGYEAYEHFTPGFNPANFKGESQNIHGDFKERNLLCLPKFWPQPDLFHFRHSQ